MAAQGPKNFEEWLEVKRGNNDNEFVSKWPTESSSFDPRDKTGYGGCTMAFGINVGYASVNSRYRLYSCMGHFKDAAVAGLPLEAIVSKVRDSPNFTTRRVDVFQLQKGKRREILSMQLAFQTPEKVTVLEYSAPPFAKYTPVDQAWSEADMRHHAQQNGVPEAFLKVVDASMMSRKRYFEIRAPQESYGTDTLHGLLPKLGRVQQHRSITEKTACYYWKCLTPLTSPASNAAALGYLLDAGMPVTGPAYAGLDLRRLGVAVSLDFALRIFVNDVDATNWLTREEMATTGGEGRTFSEARVWDQRGKMIAAMSQQCLLRPKRQESAL